MNNKDFTYEIIHTNENLDVYIELFNTNSGSYVPNHWHNSIEIIYLTSGTLRVDIGENIYHLKAGDFILINSEIVHSTSNINGNTSILLQIPITLLAKYMPNCKDFYFNFDLNSTNPNYIKNLNYIKNIFNSMEKIEKKPYPAGIFKFTSLVFDLLFQLYTNFRVDIPFSGNKSTDISISSLEPILEYTKLNYNKSISIQEISTVAHLQPEYFCRKFKYYMGQTYLSYLNELRLSYIYKDLINTDKPLYNILEIHGFTNTKLFYKLFKEKFQCTPKKIRKNI